MKQFWRQIQWCVPWLVFVLLIVVVVITISTRAHGQFGGVQQPMFSMVSAESGTFDPTSIPGIAYYWTARDTFTNDTAVSNWIDRIKGAILTNGSAAKRPLGTTTGLFFGPSTWNAPLYFSNSAGALTLTNFDCAWIVTAKIRKYESGIPMQIINHQAGLAYPIQLYSDADAPANNSGATWSHFVNPNNFAASGANGLIPTNQWVQFTIVSSNNTAHFYYTNGLLAVSNSVRTMGFQWLCSNNNETRNFDGWVSEILIYTNVVTPAQISNLFYFAYKP